MSNWVKGKIVENKHWTDLLYSLRVEADIDPFIAGQYGRLGLEIDDQIVGRPYSFVNPPHEPILEFYSIKVSEGPLSPRLAKLGVGDSLYIDKRVNGFFTLNEVPEGRDMWMLATGTALGPFLSILNSQEVWQRFENIVLVHAVRFKNELSYQNITTELKNKFKDRFQMIPFVSREKTDYAMTGRIPAAIENGLLEKKANLQFTPEDSQVMMCGNPEMLVDTRNALNEKGLKKNLRRSPGQITTESYW
jgi:ferredoxin--NADP+ reductase